MFGNTIAGELKRRLNNLRENFLATNPQTSTNNNNNSLSSRPYNSSSLSSSLRSKSSEERSATSAVIQRHIKDSSKNETIKDDVLSGKIKSTSRRDLLELENISLETFVRLLEAENQQLSQLYNEVNKDDVNDVNINIIRNDIHPNMKNIHEELLLHRRQAAVDLVESIFRCLQSRPPPRVRGDSVRSRTATQLSRDNAQSISRTSPFTSQISYSVNSEPMYRNSPMTSIGHSGGSISYNPYPIDKSNVSTPLRGSRVIDDMDDEDDSIPIVVNSNNRRGSVSRTASPVYVYSVFKVNKFRKNSPHLLEVDGRTHSLSIKDANGNTKVELGEKDLISARVDNRNLKIVTISYRMLLKDGNQQQTVVLHKKYKFSSQKYCEEFRDSVAKCIHNRTHERPSVSAITQFRRMLQEEIPSSLDPLKPRTPPTNVVRLKKPYMPMPIDLSQIVLRTDLLDASDGVAENLARLWVSNNSKENYQVNQKYGEVSSRARLKNQLRSFMGANTYSGRWQSLATLMAVDMLKLILHLGYTIELKDERQNLQEIMNPTIQKLIRKLAIENNERWCFLSQRSNIIKQRHSTEADLRSALENAELPPPPIIEEETEPPPPPSDMNNNDNLPPPPPQEIEEPPPPPPCEDVETNDNERKEESIQSSISVNLTQDSQYPIVVIRGFKDIPKQQRAFHIADATEVLRTLLEYSYIVEKAN